MHGLTFSSTALALLNILPHLPLSQPFPFPIHFSESSTVEHALVGRSESCANPCGWYKQLCCLESEECYTDENQQAGCRAKSSIAPRQGDGYWSKYTTTYIQTDLQTITSTGSTWVTAPTSNGASICDLSLGQSQCGSICCTAAQACQDNVCVEAGGSPIGNSPTPTPTQPLLPTSSGMTTITGKPTTTVPFIAPVGTDGSSAVGTEPAHDGGGLSGGAIAGIVIGVLAAVIILLLLCCSACTKGLLSSVLAIFGIGKKKRKHSSRPGSSHHSGGWVGGGGGGQRPEKKTGFFGMGKWASVAFIVGAIAVCLGLRRRKERRSEKSSSYYGSSYTYSSDFSTSSSPSSPSSRFVTGPSNPPPPPRTHTRTYSRTYSRHRSGSRK